MKILTFIMRKKGLSEVVITIILILLMLVAVGVVWIVIRNVISEGGEQVSLGMLTLNLEIENVQVNSGSIDVRVKRNAGKGDLAGINFIISDGVNTEVIKKETTMGELETVNFNLDIMMNANNAESVSIAPIFLSESGKEIIGNEVDTYKFNVEDSDSAAYVTRSFSTTAINAGDIMNILLNVSMIDDETFYAIEEYIPNEWTIIDDGGGVTSNPHILKWVVTNDAINTTYTYVVQAPLSIGDYDFNGIYMFEGFSGAKTTKGQTTMSVI